MGSPKGIGWRPEALGPKAIASPVVTATDAPALAARVLGAADNGALSQLVNADPYVNVVVAGRLTSCDALDFEQLGGELIGIDGPDGLVAACFRGGAVLPVGGGPDSWRRLALHLGRQGRGCTSLVGRAEAIDTMWPLLRQFWGPARLIRAAQPMLMLDHRPAVPADPQVRPLLAAELDRYLPAAEAMFAEELRLAPFTGAARRMYRARLSELVAARRVFVRLDRQGRVAFKAEIGAASLATCQIQGVWVRPELRGRGLGTAALASVIESGLRIAPTASLYVNDFNIAARRSYARLGMRQVATVATVMF